MISSCIAQVLADRFDEFTENLPLFLGHDSVDGDGWEVLLHEELGEGHAALDRLDEDDDLKDKFRVDYFNEFERGFFNSIPDTKLTRKVT